MSKQIEFIKKTADWADFIDKKVDEAIEGNFAEWIEEHSTEIADAIVQNCYRENTNIITNGSSGQRIFPFNEIFDMWQEEWTAENDKQLIEDFLEEES